MILVGALSRSFAMRATMMLVTVALGLTAMPHPAPAQAADTAATPAVTPLTIEHWLALGPIDAPLPALADDDPAHKVGLAELLAQPPLAPRPLWPHAGQPVDLFGSGAAAWTAVAAAGGRLTLSPAPAAVPRWMVLATYVTATGFTKGKLAIASNHPFSAWLDGVKLCDRGKPDSTAADVGAEVKLTQGKHVLVVYALADPAGPASWSLGAKITASSPETAGGLGADTSPLHPVRIRDYLDTEAISSLQLSAGGDLVALLYRRPEVPAEFSENWVEIRRAGDGALVRTIRGSHADSFRWAASGQRCSYVTSQGTKSTLWVDDLAGGPAREVLKDVEHLGSHRWLPGGRAIVISLDEERGKDPQGFQRLRGLTDRWSGARNVGSLYLVTVDDGLTRRLTAGRWSTEVQDVTADGKRLLFTRTSPDDAKFPFSEDELHELDLATLQSEKLLTVPRGVTAAYGPGGSRLLLKAGPSAFGAVGRTVPPETVPNDYDEQLFVMDRVTRAIEPITRDFAPAVESFAWSARDGRIYVTATDTTAVGLYSYDPARKVWSSLASSVETVKAMDLSADGTRLAWYGEDAMAPERAYTLDLTRKGAKPVLVATPGADDRADIRLGSHETWDFTASSGARILGDVYYPPEYSPTMSRSWPCIVFYYGGTSPVSREYGGRYPKNLWAAHGYIVYVLQPSGATGFGQEFSARHVNDWGRTTAGEIIEGTQKFLAAHPFVDPKRVGCIGASYGGFMTQLLTTKTDLFGAAVSHAGISALHSYWGEGWWGYSYSSVATAESYPWNRPDLYVEQSPLFHADRITTPLLLLHGTGDTNVPVGESEQMYTALRILGKPVEFIKVEGQNHWILNYPQRVIWMETIIAWFDKQLKRQPAWWDELYGEEKAGGGD
jgi:dipeptidyl aminopeptidase/acylaminoacyl peptidase